MNHVRQDLSNLKVAFDNACQASDSLQDALNPFIERAPRIMNKPLKEMSATDRIRLAHTIILLFDEMAEE